MILLQYSWASRVVQLVKNPLAMWEIWVGKIPLEKGKATHSSILSKDCIVHGVAKSQTQLSTFHFQSVVSFHHSLSVILLVMIGLSPVRCILKNTGMNIL